MWQANGQSLNSVCTPGIKLVEVFLNLPHDAHTSLLSPLLKQNHVKTQFIVRTLRFLVCMLKSYITALLKCVTVYIECCS